MTSAPAVALLRRPETVRDRCQRFLRLAEEDALPHFMLRPERLAGAAEYVTDTIRRNYPELQIPYHSRWRHFAAGQVDRWSALQQKLEGLGEGEMARRRIDLCVVSVLLDAGAGPDWRFTEADGMQLGRSEGLAVASLHGFAAGLFSSDPRDPLRVDAAALSSMSVEALGAAFQVGPSNPLTGLDGRVVLMRNLGAALTARPDIFGSDPARPGRLLDHLDRQAASGGLPAASILVAVLEGLAPVWPSRITLEGQNLGDVWRHPLAAPEGPAEGLLPFHKLSQWLSYSLAEVLEEAGRPVLAVDALTGLAEYRNGGLFIDLGVLRLRDPALATQPLAMDHHAIIEWRALTVALLDQLAVLVRQDLGLDAMSLPLARVLEGGSWAAGRRIAHTLRPDGGPPLRLISDGTVF
ncbi:URC4/urg3 family protein [Pseudoroseomonas globiformis]|uniref:URC4/urg3 family protein n=1 Tax=Teichococcus globiformis TaxID=2307229 RepID=A0ABV7G6T7_9PROT